MLHWGAPRATTAAERYKNIHTLTHTRTHSHTLWLAVAFTIIFNKFICNFCVRMWVAHTLCGRTESLACCTSNSIPHTNTYFFYLFFS